MIFRKAAKNILNISGVLLFISYFASTSYADLTSACADTPIDFTTDVCWECMYPMSLGDVVIQASDLPDTPSIHPSAICTCPTTAYPFVRIGLTLSFWEPARLIETVKIPYCFPALGTEISSASPGQLHGGTQKNQNEGKGQVFAQAHYYEFPVMAYISSEIDTYCGTGSSSDIDLAYMTEVDSLWNDDILSAMISPEALLFANPFAVFSCVADAANVNLSQTLGTSVNAMFYCMGSWGTAYPLTGHINSQNYVEANAGIAARLIYKMGRELMLCDHNADATACSCENTVIWNKANYRLQIAKPVRAWTCTPIGESGYLWASGKNPPFSAGGNKSDNFLWVMFRKNTCCLSYY